MNTFVLQLAVGRFSAALKSFYDMKIIESLARLELLQSTMPTTKMTKGRDDQKLTTADQVERLLAADINSGRLPPGAKLGFEMLKARYGVGVSPLREALQRLVAERLVVAEGHIGFRAAPLSVEDFQDLVSLRRSLSADAFRASIAHATPAWEGRVLAAAHELNRAPIPGDPLAAEADEWERLHRHFHATLLSACPSDRLLQFLLSLDAQFVRYRRVVLKNYWRKPSHSAAIAKQHLALAQAAVDRRVDQAVGCLQDHFDHTARDVAAELERHRPEES